MDVPTPPSPPPSSAADPDGSLLQGFFIAWGAVLGAYIFGSMLLVPLASSGIFGGVVLLLLVLAPWALGIWLIVHFAREGKPRTAKGVALGLASIVAVLVLLVSACFSLLNNTSFH